MHKHTLTRAFLGLAICASGWACDGESSSTPTAPRAPSSYMLSGAVYVETATGPLAVEQAQVRVYGREASSDEAGRYSLSNLPPGSHSVSVSKDGFQTHAQSITMTGDLQLDIVVVRIPTYTLSGVVYDVTAIGDAPLEGVEVYWSEYKGTVTDSHGVYRIDDVYAGLQPLWIRKEGFRFAVEIAHPAGEPWRNVTINGDTQFDARLVRR